jgi:uncharacterized protein
LGRKRLLLHPMQKQQRMIPAARGTAMKVLISGAGGLIGQAVSALLRARAHQVCALVRDPRRAHAGDLLWQPPQPPEAAQLAAFDAVVHLAGSPVAVRWTATAKAEIRNSRVQGTANLSRALAQAWQDGGKPRALICSSAIGYYGSRGDEVLVEDSKPGLGFLADVCCQWESAAHPAAMAGVREVHMRTSLVLGTSGGALAKMLPAFRLGVAGRLGSGRQWWSWVSLADAARAFVYALENDRLYGALNLATPCPVTNAEFTRTLARVLGRPALLAVPAWTLRLAAGEMAEEMLLASQRVMPKRLLEAGFNFEDSELEPALRRLLERPAASDPTSARK